MTRQFSVFLPNKVGRLHDLLDSFDGHAITVAGLSVVDASDHSVVRLVTSNHELAERLLIREDFRFSMADVMCVEIGKEQTLIDMCRCLLNVECQINYTYPLIVRPRNLPVLVVHTDDHTFAAQVLRRRLFTLLAENDLGENAAQNNPGTPDDPFDSGGV